MSDQIFNVVLGTAGHIDHGKSTLVKTLTGIDPDRLKEEQERGITIDLGFAPLLLSNGMRVGIIDVPGHERFIKNMVAGATGVDFVMLVIAADDGVMAQTREHLQIVQLLGVRDGLTVITKKDLVEPDYLELVIDDVKTLEAGTVLDGKPIVPVSSKTGEGIGELKRLLDELLPKLDRRPVVGPFRMPIQRVFAKEGFGTVVTGVPLSGQVAIGDTLVVLPPGFQGRVKGLHAYRSAIDHGQAGHSTAINLHGPDIDKQDVRRGMIVATPNVFQPSTLLTARLTHLKGVPWPLKHRAPVRFHAGTAEIQGKVLLLEGDQLAPGVEGWIQISLEEPTVLAPGDRFILRHQTPMVTLGGGRVVDVALRKRKRNDAGVIAELEQRLKALDNIEEFVAHVVGSAPIPKTLPELAAESAMLPQTLLELLRKLVKAGRVAQLQADALFLSPSRLQELLNAAVSSAQDYFKEHPALGAVEQPELRRRLNAKLGRVVPASLPAGAEAGTTLNDAMFDGLIAAIKQKNLLRVEGNMLSLPGRDRKLEGALAAQAQQVEAAFRAGALAPPAPADVAANLKIQPKTFREIMRYLQDTGAVIEATPELCFHQEHYEKARAAVLAEFSKKGELTTSEIRQVLGSSRKYIVPLVELFDRKKVTDRVGDKRRVHGSH
ncbi:MAG TPA: selenocysteine-specific translation elongation factor [Planctomycetota bacterium]|jgi:selenocysteine-specific elongation factor